MNSNPILLIDDTSSLRTIYAATLRNSGYDVITATSIEDARAKLSDSRFEVVLLDIMLPDGDGLELVPEILAKQPHVSIVVITAHGSVHRAVEAMRTGVFDFMLKPIDDQKLLDTVMNARSESRQAARQSAEPLGGLIGSSEVMQSVYKRVRNMAGSMATVLISGERGTGKQLCAQAIHALSPRSDGPFVAINCAAVPTDVLERELVGFSDPNSPEQPCAMKRAEGGTLFLDEVCDMDPRLQAGLLHLLQSSNGGDQAPGHRTFNTRVICTTSKDPLLEMQAGRLRSDLYYRLNILPIHLPPLRDRGGDVIEITEALLARIARNENRPVPKLSDEVRQAFLEHPWPGNVRQLESLLWNQVVLNDNATVEIDTLPSGMLEATANPRPAIPANINEDMAVERLVGLTIADVERRLIEQTIDAEKGSITSAARRLGVSPSTLYRKLEAWGVAKR